MTKCVACNNRVKDWLRDDPVCAFTEGAFSNANWNCKTLGLLRELFLSLDDKKYPEINVTFNDSENYATVNVSNVDYFHTDEVAKEKEPPVLLIVMWYKNRGATDQLYLMFDNDDPRRPTEKEVVAIIEHFEKREK